MSHADPLKKVLRDKIPGTTIPFYLVESNFVQQPDHIVALVGASTVDAALQEVFITRFVSLGADKQADLFEDGRNGPLSSLSSKNRLGLAMGLYSSEMYADIDLIRRIRNVFAHAAKAPSFTNAEIYRECQKFRFVRTKMADDVRSHEYEAKALYASMCIMISAYMHNFQQKKDVTNLQELRSLWNEIL